MHFEVAKEWVIEGLRFEKGSARIENSSLGSLDGLLRLLQQNLGVVVQVNGYTDNVGSEDTNQRLSQRRADAVADYLIKQGIDAFRITTLGYGERRPVAGNGTEQGRLKNRRVAVLLLGQNEILGR